MPVSTLRMRVRYHDDESTVAVLEVLDISSRCEPLVRSVSSGRCRRSSARPAACRPSDRAPSRSGWSSRSAIRQHDDRIGGANLAGELVELEAHVLLVADEPLRAILALGQAHERSEEHPEHEHQDRHRHDELDEREARFRVRRVLVVGQRGVVALNTSAPLPRRS